MLLLPYTGKSRAHSAAWHVGGSVFPLELSVDSYIKSWWMQSLERPCLSSGWILLLSGQTGRDSVPFLHALLCKLLCYDLFALPGHGTPRCSCYLRASSIGVGMLGHHCCWSPSGLSCCHMSCRLLWVSWLRYVVWEHSAQHAQYVS